jgi:hypothetical protein
MYEERYEDNKDDEPEDIGISLSVPFAFMSERGIIAKENFQCCTTCGCAAIEDAIKEDGHEFHGWCFYHAQDDEDRARGNSFYLTYGSVNNNDDEAKKVGEQIVQILKDHNVKTEWDGNVSHRIEVLQRTR